MSPTKPARQTLINRSIFLLSIAGVLIAIYVLQSFLRNTGIVCMTGGGCEAVRKHPASWPFGIPVPAVGLVGYLILTVSSFIRTLSLSGKTRTAVTMIMRGMAAFGAIFVSWFTYTELTVIKGVCTWCAVSTINMYVIATLLLVERYRTK